MDLRIVSRDFRSIGGSFTIDVYAGKGDFSTSCDTLDGTNCLWLYKPYDFVMDNDAGLFVPELYKMSEEELFQESLVANYGNFEYMLKVQLFVLQRFEFFKNNLGVHDYKD